MCVVGGVQDGHDEKVRESLKQVHYDYKNLLEGYDAEILLDVVGAVGLFSLR